MLHVSFFPAVCVQCCWDNTSSLKYNLKIQARLMTFAREGMLFLFTAVLVSKHLILSTSGDWHSLTKVKKTARYVGRRH